MVWTLVRGTLPQFRKYEELVGGLDSYTPVMKTRVRGRARRMRSRTVQAFPGYGFVRTVVHGYGDPRLDRCGIRVMRDQSGRVQTVEDDEIRRIMQAESEWESAELRTDLPPVFAAGDRVRVGEDGLVFADRVGTVVSQRQETVEVLFLGAAISIKINAFLLRSAAL